MSRLQNASQECKISAKFQASTFSPDKRAIVLERWTLPGSCIKVCLAPRRIRMPGGGFATSTPLFLLEAMEGQLCGIPRVRDILKIIAVLRDQSITSAHPIGRILTFLTAKGNRSYCRGAV